MNSYAFKFGNQPVELQELPLDLKRILKVQFREFVHFVEDAQDMAYKKRVRETKQYQQGAQHRYAA